MTNHEEETILNNGNEDSSKANDIEGGLMEGDGPDMGEQEETTATDAALNPEDLLRKEAAEWKDKYLRLYADFDNFRKRSMKERADLLASGGVDLMKELLAVVDDFERAIKANESVEDIEVLKEGFALIHQKLTKKLQAKGLKAIEARGQVFDTDFHEAVTQIPAPTEEMKGKVVDELEKGYLLNEKVIRFSKVVIGH
jgi:molecular chaperone GrpE